LRNLDGFHDLFEYRGFVNLTGRDFKVQRHPVAIAQQVNFRTQAPSGTA
jgi:hypothetical protein